MPDAASDLRFSIFYTTGITLIAGYLDAIGFRTLQGLYVSFMSGNSTRLGAALAGSNFQTVGAGAAVILSFVFGAFVGALVFNFSGRARLAALFACEAALVGLAATLIAGGAGFFSLLFVVVAMGMQNNAQHTLNGAGLGKSFVTGTLFGCGRSLALWVLGKADSTAALEFAGAWLAFISGVVTGAFALDIIGLPAALSVAGVALLMFAFAASRAGAEKDVTSG
jgi:uncharacterized membrane protein YoaK (UPF0700 family)